jgi:hypothetical protein
MSDRRPYPKRSSQRSWISAEEKFAVPLDVNAMKQRGWRPQYAQIDLKPDDLRFDEFFENWIEYCCALFIEDIEAVCQCMGTIICR